MLNLFFGHDNYHLTVNNNSINPDLWKGINSYQVICENLLEELVLVFCKWYTYIQPNEV